MESASTNSSNANTSASSESGSSGNGVGVAAAVAINIVRLTNTATVTNSADLTGTGAVSVNALVSLDSKAQADGMAVNFDDNASANVSAAVALNFASLTNTATVGNGSILTGNGITIQAVTTDSERNDYVATAFAVSGNKSAAVAIASVFALNVVDTETRARCSTAWS